MEIRKTRSFRLTDLGNNFVLGYMVNFCGYIKCSGKSIFIAY